MYTKYLQRYRKVGDSAFLTTRSLSIDFLFSLYSNVAHCKFFRQSNCTGASLLNGSCCEECLGLGPDRYNQLYAVFSWTYVIAAPDGFNTRINIDLDRIIVFKFQMVHCLYILNICALEMPLLYCQLEFYQTDLETEVCMF